MTAGWGGKPACGSSRSSWWVIGAPTNQEGHSSKPCEVIPPSELYGRI
jgi:hypothetical protein